MQPDRDSSIPTSAPSVPAGRLSMLAKGLSVLMTFQPGDFELSLSEISRRAKLAKPTTHRLVTELLGWGMLERGSSGLRLGQRLYVLGSRAPRQRLLREAAMPYLHRVGSATRTKVCLSVLEHHDAVHLDQVTLYQSGGCRYPDDHVITAAAYRALLAYRPSRPAPRTRSWSQPSIPTQDRSRTGTHDPELTRIRTRGYSVVRDHSGGALSVAVPLLDPGDQALAAIAVGAPAEHCRPQDVLPHLLTATTALSRKLDAMREFR
ncbi:hypothetical protein GCM10012275_19480 [Longimycelium tulufanense]|uniref:IclR family transcriptional regulator n=1 Tax=Longimycelium tulufanense TaxID=907463 RepID=A0A8J3FVY3_9PSEU|nr:helix-turn-helix domain-containing protein [Longimycelium tulufanense]GGM48653.1 hypothetical protein GCM10012275_19480 [Longimycelium tulufanense]